jgi:hypothetical protein
MRLVALAATVVGFALLGGCGGFLNASGGAATRWAAIEDAREAKAIAAADPTASVGKICKSMTATGTIMPQRVCSTQAEWDAFDAETGKSADIFNQLRNSGTVEPATEGSQHRGN